MHMAYEEMFWYGCHSGFYNGLDIFIKKFPAKLASILKQRLTQMKTYFFPVSLRIQYAHYVILTKKNKHSLYLYVYRVCI